MPLQQTTHNEQFLHLPQCYQLYLIVKLSFIEIFHIFVNMFSKQICCMWERVKLLSSKISFILYWSVCHFQEYFSIIIGTVYTFLVPGWLTSTSLANESCPSVWWAISSKSYLLQRHQKIFLNFCLHWCFTPFKLYRGNSSLIHDSWVNKPELG